MHAARSITANTQMVHRLLERRQSVEIRPVRWPDAAERREPDPSLFRIEASLSDGTLGVRRRHDQALAGEVQCHLGRAGDLLWVREALCVPRRASRRTRLTSFAADADPFVRASSRIQRPFKMRREDSRLTLEITRAGPMPLRTVSDAAIRASGVICEDGSGGQPLTPDQVEEFRACWDGYWQFHDEACLSANNPWVWVISFEVIEANVRDVQRRFRVEAA